MATTSRSLRSCAAWVPALLLLGLSGCMQADFGSRLSVQPTPQRVRETEQTTLRLPQEQKFNIALAPSQRSPGVDGTAEADSSASGDGYAEAHAAAATAGTSSAAFQLGHALHNGTDRQVDFDFRVRCRYQYEASAEPHSTQPDALVTLLLHAQTGDGRRITELQLVRHGTDGGDVQRSSSEDLHFVATLGPGQSLNTYLAGAIQVNVDAGRRAAGALKVESLEMEVTTHPAPATRVSGHEPQ